MSHLPACNATVSQPFWKLFRRPYIRTQNDPAWPHMDILHTAPDSHGNMLTNIVSLLLSPFSSFPGSRQSRVCDLSTCCYYCSSPPGRPSWENTESGSGLQRPDRRLWTPEGPRGPSGFRQITHKQWFRAWRWNVELFLTDTTTWIQLLKIWMGQVNLIIHSYLCQSTPNITGVYSGWRVIMHPRFMEICSVVLA